MYVYLSGLLGYICLNKCMYVCLDTCVCINSFTPFYKNTIDNLLRPILPPSIFFSQCVSDPTDALGPAEMNCIQVTAFPPFLPSHLLKCFFSVSFLFALLVKKHLLLRNLSHYAMDTRFPSSHCRGRLNVYIYKFFFFFYIYHQRKRGKIRS